MSEARVLSDAPWLQIRSGRARARVAQWRWRGSPRGRWRRAQCAAEYSARSTSISRPRRRPTRWCAAPGRPASSACRRGSTTARSRSSSKRSRSRSRPCARIPKPSAARPGLCSGATGFATPNGATSPSTGFRSMPAASCMITSVALPTSKPGACASSATPASASPRIICVSFASFACMPPTGRVSPTVPDISPASTGARDFRTFPPNACAWRW